MVHDVCASLKSKFFIPSKYHITSTIITKWPHLPPHHSIAFFLGQLEGVFAFVPLFHSQNCCLLFPSAQSTGSQIMVSSDRRLHGFILLQTHSQRFPLSLFLPTKDVQPERLLLYGPIENSIPDELPILS